MENQQEKDLVRHIKSVVYYYLLLGRRRPTQRIAPAVLEQLYDLSALGLQTPLRSLKEPIPLLPPRHKPRPPLRLRPLDPETNINIPVQLVHLPPDPWHLARKVDLVAEERARGRVGAEGVEHGGDRRRGLFLVVEDGEGGEHDHDDEDR